MDSKLSRWCEGVLEAAWLTAVIAVPLFFNIHSDRVFEPDKLTLLRSIALVALAAWIVRFIDQRGWQDLSALRWGAENSVWKRPFVLPVALVVLVYLLTTLTSVSPRVSWAGSYQRLQGTYTTLSYIIIFFVILSTMRTRPQLKRLVTFIVITSIPIAFYGLLQHFALDPLPWGGNVTDRVAGHMGNAIFIAAYLIMVVPLTLAQILDAFTRILRDEEMSYADVARSSIYIFTLAIQLLTIYWSGSRGPWIGLAVGLFAFTLILLVTLRDAAVLESQSGFKLLDAGKALLFLLLPAPILFLLLRFIVRGVTSVDPTFGNFVAFASTIGLLTVVIFVMMGIQRGWKWLWLSWILLAVFTAGWLVTFNFAEQLEETPVISGVATELAAWKELPRIGRLGRLLESDSGTGKVRVLIWEGALDLIAADQPIEYPDGSRDPLNFLRPLIGYGPESMYVAYNQYYPPELATLEARNASPDRSHNETFDALVITGVLGFIVWQLLYLSVFYYGLTWLGVVQQRRDSIMLIAFWLGGALLLTLLVISTLGAEFLGVAIPLGSIVGLVLYLITYAITSRPSDAEQPSDPFAVDRLLLLALLSGIVAHYVEIHFGIAIAASRVHFFVFVALMAMIGGQRLAKKGGQTAVSPSTTTPTSSRKGRKSRRSAPTTTPSLRRGWFSPSILAGLLISLLIGILAFNYTTYALPPGVELTSPDDLGTLDIIRQSMLVNVNNDFRPSPFIFLLMMLSWLLSVLLIVSEMVKSGDISPLNLDAEVKQENNQLRIAAALLLASGLLVVVFRLFIAPPDPQDPTQLLGRSMSTIWLALTLWSAVLLFLQRNNGRLVAALIALLGLLMVLPLLLASGGLYALFLLLTCAPVLYLTNHRSIAPLLYPAATVGGISIVLGLGFALLHTNVFRAAILAQPTFALETVEDLLRWRVQEASLASGILTLFYLFVFMLLLLAGTAVATPRINRVRQSGWGVAFASLAILFLGTAVTIDLSNLQVVQADMVYKRGKPFDNQATRQQDVQAWDTAIAIYEETVDLAPREDFYYLFLGRAYLERSTITQDPLEQQQLLAEAEGKLITAQTINPLNTDHTANLARLNTRWLQFSTGDTEREARFAEAEAYYQDALALSPQNSLIRNEYARLLFDLRGDCADAAAVYEESITIDPFFADTYFGYADLNVSCAAAEPDEEERRAYYETAVSLLEQGLERNSRFDRAWLQVAQLHQELGNYGQAVAAFEEVRSRNLNDRLIPTWNLDYLVAGLYSEQGNTELAATFGQQALSQAPADVRPQIQDLLNDLGVEGIIPLDPPETEAPVDLGEPVDLGDERPLASLPPAQRNGFYDSPPPTVIDTSNNYEAIVTTENGRMRFALFDDEAPLTVNNFVFLAQQGFYDNTTFHRVLEDFMAQAGDPLGVGTGGPGYQFQDEFNNGLSFDKPGLLAMANAGPNTNGSQFFITFAPTPWLDGNHTIFGELLEGEDVLNQISLRDPAAAASPGDALISIEIIEAP